MEREHLHSSLQTSERDDVPATQPSGGGASEDGMTADELWTTVLGDMKGRMVDAAFYRWLYGSKVVEQRDGAPGTGVLVIGVRDRYAVDWLTHRLKRVIENSCYAVAGEVPALEFVVAPAQRPGKEQRSAHAPKLEARGCTEPARNLRGRKARVREKEVTTNSQPPSCSSGGTAKLRESAARGQDPGLVWTDYYIKLKLAFRVKALATLKGAKLSVFLCLALHADGNGIAHPGIEAIMRETSYGRTTVCRALDELVSLRLIRKCDRRGKRCADQYKVLAYAWIGGTAAASLWEVEDGR